MGFPNSTARLDIGRVIEARFSAQWTVDGSYRTVVQFPSVLGLIATDTTTVLNEPPTGASWIKLDIVDGETEAVCYGGTSGSNRAAGLIQLMTFSPRQAGDATLFTLAGYANAIFDRYHANGLRCRASAIQKIDPEKGWNRAIIRTPFEYYIEVTT